MDSMPRNVPWRDWHEWFQVKNDLYSDSTPSSRSTEARNSVSRGIKMVNVWRVRGGLPHSVESTACLLQIEGCGHDHKIEEEEGEEECGGKERMSSSSPGHSPQRSEMELRMTYSLAIIRAVNGLVDPLQKGLYADSIMSIAAARGLPSWIVELRHDSTHNQLPALSVLRSASSHLIQWFHNNYWEVQSQHISTYVNAYFDKRADGGEEKSLPEVIESSAIESINDICPTGITGPFMARILDNGLLADNVASKFDRGVFQRMCTMKNTTVIDTFIARLLKHALDQVETIGAQTERQKAGDEINCCRQLLELAEEPWKEMHEKVLSQASSKEAFHDKKLPAKLLHSYWKSLLVRAHSTMDKMNKRFGAEDHLTETLRSICETFQGLTSSLARYDAPFSASPQTSLSSSSCSQNSQKKKKRKKDEVETSSTEPVPSGWTVYNGEMEGLAWPLGMDPNSK